MQSYLFPLFWARNPSADGQVQSRQGTQHKRIRGEHVLDGRVVHQARALIGKRGQTDSRAISAAAAAALRKPRRPRGRADPALTSGAAEGARGGIRSDSGRPCMNLDCGWISLRPTQAASARSVSGSISMRQGTRGGLSSANSMPARDFAAHEKAITEADQRSQVRRSTRRGPSSATEGPSRAPGARQRLQRVAPGPTCSRFCRSARGACRCRRGTRPGPPSRRGRFAPAPCAARAPP